MTLLFLVFITLYRCTDTLLSIGCVYYKYIFITELPLVNITRPLIPIDSVVYVSPEQSHYDHSLNYDPYLPRDIIATVELLGAYCKLS